MRSITGSNVCVVGGAGFLGSHLVDYLVEERECRVIVVDNLEVGRREFLNRNAVFVYHDITGSELFLLNLFRSNSVQFVFNYAARPYVPDSYYRPLRTIDVNCIGALKVVNAAQEAGCQAVLQVSSAELYGGWEFNMQHDGRNSIRETDEVSPHSTYGAAKAAVDYACQVAWKERHTPVIALRQFNCVGPRETHPYVIPDIISQVALSRRREPKTMWPRKIRLGNNSRRDFLYAGDAVAMATELIEKGSFGEVYNLGSESSIAIYDLAQLVGKVMGTSVEVEEDPSKRRAWEIWHLQSDNTKINSIIECRPKVGLEEAVALTVADFMARNERWTWQEQ